MIGISSL